MAHQFPEIVAYASAFRCALEAEQACVDFATAAGVLAPDQAWRDKLKEVVCTHDDRVAKLRVTKQEVNEMILEPIHSLDVYAYLGTLDAEPATSWPAAALQLIQAEEDTARYQEDFVAQCEEMLAASAGAFKKTAKQDRACAAAPSSSCALGITEDTVSTCTSVAGDRIRHSHHDDADQEEQGADDGGIESCGRRGVELAVGDPKQPALRGRVGANGGRDEDRDPRLWRHVHEREHAAVSVAEATRRLRNLGPSGPRRLAANWRQAAQTTAAIARAMTQRPSDSCQPRTL